MIASVKLQTQPCLEKVFTKVMKRPDVNGLGMKRFLLGLLLVSFSGFSFAYTPSTYSSLLGTYVVDSGFVDYDAWLANPDDVAKLQGFIDEMATYDPSGLRRESELAFWINAYNAITLNEVLKRYPLETVRPKFLGIPVTSFFTKKEHTVNGQAYSLDDIENNVLRKLGEPRIHFAINCASTSCPVLRPETYRGEVLDKQLDEQAVKFIGDPDRNRFNVETNQASLSQIFEWFEGDFDAVGGVPSFLSQFATGDAKTVLESDQLNIEYITYDWALNRAR